MSMQEIASDEINNKQLAMVDDPANQSLGVEIASADEIASQLRRLAR